MAIYVYNTKQQALDSKKIAELFSFTSNDFAGLISNSANPIVANVTEQTKTWSWDPSLEGTQVSFMGGGVDIAYDVPASPTPEGADDKYPKVFNQTCSVWGLKIGVPSSTATIASDVFTAPSAQLTEVSCRSIEKDYLYIVVSYPAGNPSAKQYYEYTGGVYALSEDTQVDASKTYYLRLDCAFKVTGADFGLEQLKNFEYYGNTIWVTQNEFFIPFCGLYNNQVIPMLFNRDKTGYESFLTARTYYHLLQELGNQFVWRVGGPTLGNVGDLNITDNYITNKENAADGVKIDRPILTNVATSGTAQSKYMADYMLIVDENGVLREAVDYRIPVTHGGTGAINQGGARLNLGFSNGTATPTNPPTPRPDGSVDKGAVYFKILV